MKRPRSLNGDQPELDLVQVWPLASIRGAPENDEIYNPIAFDDPDIQALARSIKKHGIQEPLLVSSDSYLISGHRHRIAATLLDLKDVPVRVHPVSHAIVRSGPNFTKCGSRN